MKDQSQIVPRFDKKNIDVTMEPWQDTGLFLYGLECRQCHHACEFHFINRKGLSFATVGKLGAVFSLPCKRLVEEESHRASFAKQDGQKSLMSLVSGNSGDENER